MESFQEIIALLKSKRAIEDRNYNSQKFDYSKLPLDGDYTLELEKPMLLVAIQQPSVITSTVPWFDGKPVKFNGTTADLPYLVDKITFGSTGTGTVVIYGYFNVDIDRI